MRPLDRGPQHNAYYLLYPADCKFKFPVMSACLSGMACMQFPRSIFSGVDVGEKGLLPLFPHSLVTEWVRGSPAPRTARIGGVANDPWLLLNCITIMIGIASQLCMKKHVRSGMHACATQLHGALASGSGSSLGCIKSTSNWLSSHLTWS